MELVEVSVFGSYTKILLDSSVVPNVLSTSMCAWLHLQSQKNRRIMKMANWSEAETLEEVNKIPITIGGVTYCLSFMTVKEILRKLIIGKPAMKTTQTALDSEKKSATLPSGAKAAILPLW